jgi:hypothetical protein
MLNPQHIPSHLVDRDLAHVGLTYVQLGTLPYRGWSISSTSWSGICFDAHALGLDL